MSQPSSRSELLQAQVRTYFEACNEGNHAKMAAGFSADIVHYFPPGMFGPCVGSRAIANLCRRMDNQAGSRWTINRIVSDGNEDVIERTHWETNSERRIPGADGTE